MSRRKDAARSPHFNPKVPGSGRQGMRARKGKPCPVCNRRRRRGSQSCHLVGKYGHVIKGGFREVSS